MDPETGEVAATFGVHADALIDGGYDSSGRWLMLVFADGTAELQGGGQRLNIPLEVPAPSGGVFGW